MIEKYFKIGRCRFLVETILTLNKNMPILIPGNVHQWCSQGFDEGIKNLQREKWERKGRREMKKIIKIDYDIEKVSVISKKFSFLMLIQYL